MMKQFSITVIAALLLFPAMTLGQVNNIEPGIYTLVDGQPIPLNFSYSVSSVKGENLLGVELSNITYRFRGETSGTVASNTFILAVNPRVGTVEKKFKKYDPFIRSMKPSRVIIVPLKVNPEKQCREYYPGMVLEGLNVSERAEMDFESEKISDNIFKITVKDLKPGEYAFVFKHASILEPDFSAIYGFTYSASSQEKRTNQVFKLNLSRAEKGPNLWKTGYNKTNWEIMIGYVNKSMLCDYGNGMRREDYFGDTDTKFIHGVQMGVLYTPSFDWGLGARTGLLLEVYESKSIWVTTWCDKFSEGNLSIPLHASYRFPVSEDTCFNLYGGLAFQWVIQGRYENYYFSPSWRRRTVTVGQPEYGNGWPKRVNLQAELGVNFHFKGFGLNFSYGFGLIEQGIENTFDGGETFISAIRSRQDKMQATILITL